MFYIEDVVKLLPGNVYWCDKDLVYMGCNAGILRLLNAKSQKEVVGKNIFDLFPDNPDIAQRVYDQDKEILENKKEVAYEEKALNEAGEEAIYLTRKSPILNESEEAIGLIGISIDITAEKKVRDLEAKTLMANEKAALEKGEMIRVLAGSIAHELQTPLAGIQACLYTLERELSSYANKVLDKDIYSKLVKYINKANRFAYSTEQAMNMNLKNIKTENTQVQIESVKIHDLIRKSINEYPFSKRKDMDIHIELAPSIVKVDALEMKHVLWNLLKNAIYAIQKANKGAISILGNIQKDLYCLTFRDTGSGMTKEVQEKIFDPYFTTKRNGTGIGLAYSAAIIKKLGGIIKVRSEEGQYTEFVIHIPLAMPAHDTSVSRS